MKKALMVWGGWEGHEPQKCVERFAPFLRANGFEVEISDTLDAYLDPEKMSSLNLVVQVWTMGTITDAQQKGLIAAVRDHGVGLAGWHGGLVDPFRNSVDYQFMTGAQWVAHPGNVMDFDISIARSDDPITAGLTDFSMHSEQYYLHVDPLMDVLATTTLRRREHPLDQGRGDAVVWKRRWGKGKLFGASYGHVASDFDVKEARTIVERGMLWASR